MNSKIAQYAAILELTGQITSANVKSAYRREMQRWHPDLHFTKETASIAHTKAQAINEAYEFLSEVTEEEIIPTVESPKVRTYDKYRTRHTYHKRTFKTGFPDPTVFEVFVKSSNIVSAGYNTTQCILYLKFHNGSIYRYFNVPRVIFDELLRAESHGRYVNRNICNSFTYERC